MGCEDVSARMVELLYGEVPADERATLEAHLGGCARCQAELAALQATRAAARRTLDDDAPPARAHQAILRAAAAAVAAREPQPIAARPAPQRSSVWQRLRLRWTLPTFATVGAVAVVVLASKVFLEPQKTVELGRQALRPAAAEAPVVPAAAPPPEARKSAKDERPTEERAVGKNDVEVAKQPATDKPLARSTAAPPRERKRAAPGDALGGLGFAKGAVVPTPKKAEAAFEDFLDESDEAGPAPKPSKRGFAPPPPARAAAPSAPAPAGAAGKLRLDDDVVTNAGPTPGRAGSGRLQGGSGAAAPAAHAAAKAKKAPLPEEELAGAPPAATSTPAPASPPPAPVAPAAAREEDRESRRADTTAEAKPAVESPVARADRLYAQGRWVEAAQAYRELLRRDPRNADAPRWRQRLGAAEAAIAPEAPAAATAPAP
ncbi:MAG TPA: zf-HC2 domain-containing protein [Polyangia bacterium]